MLPAIATITELQKQFRVRLRYLGTELVLDNRDRTFATLGRGQENDLVIKGNLVSRLHARVEAGKNRFMLVDQSTNGSFVQSQNGDDAFVRRDAIPLKGQGVIGLGRVPEPQSYHTVEFFCEDGPELSGNRALKRRSAPLQAREAALSGARVPRHRRRQAVAIALRGTCRSRRPPCARRHCPRRAARRSSPRRVARPEKSSASRVGTAPIAVSTPSRRRCSAR